MGFFDKLFGGGKSAKPQAVAADAGSDVVCAPVSGKVSAMEDVPDPMFAQEVMGKTVAIWPSSGDVFAPIAGTVTTAMPHAFGIEGDNGAEVLIHVGVDTVNMKGDGFTVWTKVGDHVDAGEPLLTFNRAKVAKAGYKDIVMTIVTNSDDYPELAKVAEGEVTAGGKVINLQQN